MTERINAFLRSEAALLTLLAMALISQTPHTAVLFHRLSPAVDGIANTATWLHAVAYAIALEFATLVFVVRGQRRLAWLFAGVSIAVNLLYYAVGTITPIYVLSALMVSIALPSSIAFYSHSVAEHAGNRAEAKRTVTKPSKQDVTPVTSAPGQVDDAPTQDVTLSPVNKSELARQHGVTRQTIDRWIKAGKITLEQPHLNGATGD